MTMPRWASSIADVREIGRRRRPVSAVLTKLQADDEERDETRGRANGGMTSSRRLPPPVGDRRGARQRSRARRLASRSRAIVSGASAGGAAGGRRDRGRRAGGRRRPGSRGRSACRRRRRSMRDRSGRQSPERPACRLGRCASQCRPRLARPGPAARRQHPFGGGRSRCGRPTPSPDPADPAARRHQLAPPERHPAQGDVERPQEQRQDEEQRPQVGEPVGGGQVVPPRVERRGDDRPAGRRPQRGQERLVGAELPVLGRGLGDQPDRPTERRRARPGLGHPDRVRPRLDLAERRLVDPGRDLDEARRSRGSRSGPTMLALVA